MSTGARSLVLATRNAHKLREFSGMLPGWQIEPLPDDVELPPETAESFAGNAIEKARAAQAATGMAAIADDSGISARALDGAPGVRSARYAGEGATDAENLDRLLSELAPHADRGVEYVCVIAYVGTDGEERLFEGRCAGNVIDAPRGEGGFGYDPVVVPLALDDGRTMAEISQAEKDAISHRGAAARELQAWLEQGEAAR